MITPIDMEDLLEFVGGRLFGGGDDDRLATAAPADAAQEQGREQARAYAAAKRKARAGDPEPLRKILVDLTGDQELAAFITTPATSSHARKKLARAMPFVKFARENQGAMIREIRELVQEKVGASRNSALVVEIAAKVLNCPEDEIHRIIKRGY